MAFASSLYIGASGLVTHGEKMRGIGHDLANSSTVAYKQQDMHFQNLLAQNVAGGHPRVELAQVGQGVRLMENITDFNQGDFSPGDAVTDMAIMGKGFFQVGLGDELRYTRAGNFRFDNQGFLRDPNGGILQGLAIDDDGATGALGDIQLSPNDDGYYTTDATATSEVTMITNLGDPTDYSANAQDPFFSLLSAWDADADTPLASSSYGFTNSLQVYDENGNAHDLTLYADAVTVSNGAPGRSYYEFVLAAEGAVAEGASGASSIPVMVGAMTFDATGNLENIAAFTQASGGAAVTDLSSWAPASLEGGLPQFTVNFEDTSSGAAAGATVSQSMTFDFGISGGSNASFTNGSVTAADVGGSAASLPGFAQTSLSSLSTTAYSGGSSVSFQNQDGAPEGYLQNLEITDDGFVRGRYNNNTNKDLFQVQLFYFPSQYGLRRAGDNYYCETAASGASIQGSPNDPATGLGELTGNQLEGSNVDMATEFANMIMTQRGFQANSKIISTTDRLIEVATQMKK